jgi:hypothetical protein
VFTEEKGFWLPHYDYTQKPRREDFEECRDSFKYRETLDPLMVQAFKAACATIQPQRG